eukprot:scaffold14248_cov59-Phaeocystis_antarctica.AAC.3
MGSCSPSLWHRFQLCTLSGERVDFVRCLPPGSRVPFTQRVHLMGPRVILLYTRYRSSLNKTSLYYCSVRVSCAPYVYGACCASQLPASRSTPLCRALARPAQLMPVTRDGPSSCGCTYGTCPVQ